MTCTSLRLKYANYLGKNLKNLRNLRYFEKKVSSFLQNVSLIVVGACSQVQPSQPEFHYR